MKVISGAASELSDELFAKVCSYRHKVFVETLGWELDTEEGIELDQFDHAGTIYVVAQDEDGAVIGCGRLLPTRVHVQLHQQKGMISLSPPTICNSAVDRAMID